MCTDGEVMDSEAVHFRRRATRLRKLACICQIAECGTESWQNMHGKNITRSSLRNDCASTKPTTNEARKRTTKIVSSRLASLENIRSKLQSLYALFFITALLPVIPSKTVIAQQYFDDFADFNEDAAADNFYSDWMATATDDFDIDPSWELEKSCRFFASSGRLFNQSVMTEVKGRIPLDEHYAIKVYITDHELSEWLKFRKDSLMLEGVPLDRHVAISHNLIIALLHGDFVTLTIPCSVVVDSRVNYGDTDLEVVTETMQRVLRCAPNEPIIVVGLQLSSDITLLDAERRIRLVRMLCGLLHGSVPCDTITIAIGGRKAQQKTHPIQAGPGNVVGNASRVVTDDIAVSWPLACASESFEPTIVEEMKELAANGQLSEAIGFDVLGWRVDHRRIHPRFVETASPKRLKRNTDFSKFRSPTLAYPELRSTESARRYKGEYVRVNDRHDWRKHTENEMHVLHEFLADEAPASRRRMRVSHRSIFQSPALNIPHSTPFIEKLSSVMPNTPTVMIPNHAGNQAPIANLDFSSIPAQRLTYFEQPLDEDTFVDREDGNAHALDLQLEVLSPEGAWLRLNQSTLMLYGVPPDEKNPNTNGEGTFEFALIATDSSQLSTSARFTVKVKQCPRPYNHRFTTVFTTEDRNLDASKFARRLSSALNTNNNSPPGHYIVFKYNRSKGRVKATWFDSEIGSRTVCARAQLDRVWITMTGNSLTDPGQVKERVAVSDRFAALFEPELTPKSCTVTLSGPCKQWQVQHPRTTTTPVSSEQSQTTKNLPISIELEAEIGQVTVLSLPACQANSRLEIIPRGQSWMAINPRTQSIIILPTFDDVTRMTSGSPLSNVWLGQVVGEDDAGHRQICVELRVNLSPLDVEVDTLSSTHRFTLIISNYDLKNFTVLDSERLLNVIRMVYGDSDFSNIYVYPPNAGSVVFSWHNKSLSTENESCVDMDVALLAAVILRQGSIREDFEKRLMQESFVIDSVSMERTNRCLSPSTIPSTTTTKPVESKMTPTITTITSKETTSTTTKMAFPRRTSSTTPSKLSEMTKTTTTTTTTTKLAPKAKGARSGSVVIVIVVLVCVALLVLICFVKWRGVRKAREKTRTKNQEPVSDAALKPRIYSEASKTVEGSKESKQLRYKRGTPIVFTGEYESDNATPLLAKDDQHQTSSFTPHDRRLKSQPDKTVLDTASTTWPANIDPYSRPPPPPYVPQR